MFRKSFVFTLIVVLILAVSVYGATAQEPQAEMAGNGGCEAGSAYDPNCDVNHDGDMTVEDLSLVANHWGQAGVSTAAGDFQKLDGNAIAANDLLDRTNHQSVVFKTYDANVGRIDTAGNVDIGTTSPGSKLAVPQRSQTETTPRRPQRQAAAPLVCDETIYVDASYNGPGAGTSEQPFRTVRAAHDAASDGACIIIRAGLYSGMVFTKRVTVSTEGGVSTIGVATKPIIGITYLTWFDYETPGSGCSGNGWREGPFGLEDVRSLSFGQYPDGYCYSSMDPETAKTHAGLLDELNISFVIYDTTNFSKAIPPSQNGIFQGALKAMEGFRMYGSRRIKSVFQLSLTCWAESCHGRPGGQTEIFTFNDHVKAHIDAIANHYIQYPNDFLKVENKPLLLFYINMGSNVKNLDGSPAFHGPGNLHPTVDDFDYQFSIGGQTYHIREFFTVRYTVVADTVFDYSAYSHELWPFNCYHGDCTFTEAGYASLLAPKLSSNRDIDLFNRLVENSRSKDYLVIRVWNEFSSTDEFGAQAYTIEPNTQLYKIDTTPGNQDPWYFFNQIKDKLRALR